LWRGIALDQIDRKAGASSIRGRPTFSSALTATEMAEVYWLALTRDVLAEALSAGVTTGPARSLGT